MGIIWGGGTVSRGNAHPKEKVVLASRISGYPKPNNPTKHLTFGTSHHVYVFAGEYGCFGSISGARMCSPNNHVLLSSISHICIGAIGPHNDPSITLPGDRQNRELPARDRRRQGARRDLREIQQSHASLSMRLTLLENSDHAKQNKRSGGGPRVHLQTGRSIVQRLSQCPGDLPPDVPLKDKTVFSIRDEPRYSTDALVANGTDSIRAAPNMV